MTSTPRTYRVTFVGEVGPATRAAFVEMEAHVEQGRTVLSGESLATVMRASQKGPYEATAGL